MTILITSLGEMIVDVQIFTSWSDCNIDIAVHYWYPQMENPW